MSRRNRRAVGVTGQDGSYLAELLLANVRHQGDAVILASAIARSAQQVAARPGIETREDLRGKRWGVTARNDADECAIIMAFDRWGWSIDKDAEIVVVGQFGLCAAREWSIRSPIGGPARIGAPLRSPVTLMNPLIAWAMKSKDGRSR